MVSRAGPEPRRCAGAAIETQQSNLSWYHELWVTVVPGGSREMPVFSISLMGTRSPAARRKLLCHQPFPLILTHQHRSAEFEVL